MLVFPSEDVRTQKYESLSVRVGGGGLIFERGYLEISPHSLGHACTAEMGGISLEGYCIIQYKD